MREAVTSRAAARESISRAGLWFGFIGGGIAWTTHLVAAYAIAEFGCVSQLGERGYGGISLVAWMELAATILTACLAAAATAVAYRCQRQLSALGSTETTFIAEKSLARAGLLASGFFTFVILFESIPILFYLRHC